MVKSASGECHESRDLWTSHGGSSLCVFVELAWWFVIWSNSIVSEGNNTGEVRSLNFQGENPRSGLNYLCMEMTLLKALFLLARTFSRVKTSDLWPSDDGACVLFFSWRRRFWRSWTSGVVLVVLVLLL
jgi:hypothetical protein